MYLSSRACWLTAFTAFLLTISLLLIATDLNLGFTYAIAYGVFLLILFTTAGHAVYARPHALPLRPGRLHRGHPL